MDIQQESIEQLRLKAHLANGNRKIKTSEGTRRSMPIANLAYNNNEAINANTLTPLMESMDTPRIFRPNGPTSHNTLNQYGTSDN